MQKLFILLLSVSLLSACNTSPNETKMNSSKVVSAHNSSQTFTKNVKAAEFKSLIEKNVGTIIDVRTPREFAAGHIKGATNIVLGGQLTSSLKTLDKSKTYLLYCRSGARSGRATQQFKSMGFQKVYNLSGGLMGWQRSGLPVVK